MSIHVRIDKLIKTTGPYLEVIFILIAIDYKETDRWHFVLAQKA
jgi:hypothetical protein